VKKLFALLAVAALAAVGCDDKKTTAKPADKTTPHTTPMTTPLTTPATTPATTVHATPATTPTSTKSDTKKDGPNLPDGKEKPKGGDGKDKEGK
jgi:hypothetical protein